MVPVPPQGEHETMLQNVMPAERILFFDANATKGEILKALVDTLKLPDPQGALKSILEREEAGGILIKPNVAIPHTTIPGINGVRASLGIQRSNDEFSQSHFWLLFVSGTESIKEHLQFLRNVALTITDELLKELAKSKTAREAKKAINEIS